MSFLDKSSPAALQLFYDFLEGSFSVTWQSYLRERLRPKALRHRLSPILPLSNEQFIKGLLTFATKRAWGTKLAYENT